MSGVRSLDPVATTPLPSLDELLAQYALLLSTLPVSGPVSSDELYPLLLLRDGIAASIRDGRLPSLLSVNKIRQADEALKSVVDRIAPDEVALLEGLRDAVQPPNQNWWWYRQKFQSPWWTISSTILLTLSVTMITDFAHRILTSDPDELGIFALAFQAILAVAASSAFTDRGGQWIEDVLLRRRVPLQHRGVSKLMLTTGLFGLVFFAWSILPRGLAWFYNHLGAGTENPTSFQARRYFQRAAALDPGFVPAHFNLGSAYEESFEYDKAIVEYQKALVINSLDVAAYANLSRLLVIENQPLTALRAADNGITAATEHLPRTPTAAEKQIIATLLKDRAWAELQLGFYSAGEADATIAAKNQNVAPAAWCVLGKIYAKQDKAAEEREAWKKFHHSLLSTKQPSTIEPDCTRLAEAIAK